MNSASDWQWSAKRISDKLMREARVEELLRLLDMRVYTVRAITCGLCESQKPVWMLHGHPSPLAIAHDENEESVLASAAFLHMQNHHPNLLASDDGQALLRTLTEGLQALERAS